MTQDPAVYKLERQLADMQNNITQLRRESTHAQVQSTRMHTGSLSAAGRLVNLCTNPSFENGLVTPWVMADTVAINPGAAVVAGGRTSSKALQLSTASLASGRLAMEYSTSQIRPGGPLSASCTIRPTWWFGDATQPITFEMEWSTAAGEVLGTQAVSSATPGLFTGNEWTPDLHITAINPLSATKVTLRIRVDGADAQGVILLIDEVLLYAGSLPVPYFDGDYENATWNGLTQASTSSLKSSETTRTVSMNADGIHQRDGAGRTLISMSANPASPSGLLSIQDPTTPGGTLTTVAGGGVLSNQVGAINDLSHQGEQLSTIRANQGGNIVAFSEITTRSPRTAAEVGVVEVAFNAKANRMYEVSTSPLQVHCGSTITLAELDPDPYSEYYSTSTQSIPSAASYTSIRYQTASHTSPNVVASEAGNSEFQVKKAGHWTLGFSLGLGPGGAGVREFVIEKMDNATAMAIDTRVIDSFCHFSLSRTVYLGYNDLIRGACLQTSGGAITTDNYMAGAVSTIKYAKLNPVLIRFRGTTNGTAPTIASTQLSQHDITEGSSSPTKFVYSTTTDHVARILLTVAHAGPVDNLYSHIFGSSTQPIQLAVRDVGPKQPTITLVNNGSGSSPDGVTAPPSRPKIVKTKQYLCSWSRAYDGPGNEIAGDGQALYQGTYSAETGEYLSFIGFDAAAIAADLATQAGVVSVRLRLYSQFWQDIQGGTAVIGYHNLASVPSSVPDLSSYSTNVTTHAMGQPDLQWVTLPDPSTLITQLASGAVRGMVLSARDYSGLSYYGKFHGNDMPYEPILEVKYTDT